MRLKYIEKVDFRKSEMTNWVEFAKANKAVVDDLKGDDVVLFISTRGDQLVFLHGFEDIVVDEKPRRVLASHRLRVGGGKWNPLMLQNYATQCNLRLNGLKRFEDYYRGLTS